MDSFYLFFINGIVILLASYFLLTIFAYSLLVFQIFFRVDRTDGPSPSPQVFPSSQSLFPGNHLPWPQSSALILRAVNPLDHCQPHFLSWLSQVGYTVSWTPSLPLFFLIYSYFSLPPATPLECCMESIFWGCMSKNVFSVFLHWFSFTGQ